MFSTNAGMCLLVMNIVCSIAALNNKSCETPDFPENGFVIISKGDPTLAVYLCSSGYVLNGQSHRVCASNGEWDGRTPSCLLETKESSSNVAAIIGGLLGGSAILGLTSGAIVYLIMGRKKDKSGPCITFCPKNINNVHDDHSSVNNTTNVVGKNKNQFLHTIKNKLLGRSKQAPSRNEEEMHEIGENTKWV
ncbi:sushi, von Willebrand factor type A, EGF and pentraxin domain-containing protein 1-like [Ruditapes philippinarum]|uniref:sushi, von Willebrand factor type A, EGF and pentraxin domain-containing protein 1-like n=1 Tax=Ruditapes philippinarum TaxID=129788 RepID=UPI00295B4576|nr:sushi, von Willebrand factor type A, EGF and pentraxin domain-containing protein 1-like [Ruditapes philippinarum]